MTGFSGIDRACVGLFILVVAILGVEYVKLPLGLSLYKVVIVPSCLLGISLLLIRGVRISSLMGLIPLIAFIPLMVFSYLKWGVLSSLTTAVGLAPFIVFTYYFLVVFGWPIQASIALAVWSIPHLVTLVLFQMGLSNAAFTDSPFRFDGVHSDPNFMVLFVLASASGKAVVWRRCQSSVLKVGIGILIFFDVLMIGMSGSRGGALGLLITFFVFVSLRKGIKKTTYLFLVLGILLASSFQVIYHNLPEKIAHSPFLVTVDRIIYSEKMVDKNSSSAGRLYLWENAVRMQKEKGMMVGYTIENFRRKYWLFPHNTFLDAVLECGLPGLILLLSIIGFSAVFLLRNISRLDVGGVQALLMGVAFWGILLFLSSFTTKVFWLSVILPYSMSIRLMLDPGVVGIPWRKNESKK